MCGFFKTGKAHSVAVEIKKKPKNCCMSQSYVKFDEEIDVKEDGAEAERSDTIMLTSVPFCSFEVFPSAVGS